jgi:hypothetical protein
MVDGNPLVAEAPQDGAGPGPLTAGNGDYGYAGGIGIAESAMDAFNGISEGNWVEGGLGVLGLAAEAASAAIDPFGWLMSSVASFLMEHMQPLKDMLDWLAGDPPVIQSYSETWANVAASLEETQVTFTNAVKNGTSGWTGAGADAYRESTAEQAEAIAGAATVSSAISTVVMIMGEVVAFVRETVRDLIADLVGKLISWVLETVFSLGFGTPVVVAQAVTAISKWAARIAELVQKLLGTIKRVSPLLGKLAEVFTTIIKLFGKLAGKITGLDVISTKNITPGGFFQHGSGDFDGPSGGNGGNGGSGGPGGGSGDSGGAGDSGDSGGSDSDGSSNGGSGSDGSDGGSNDTDSGNTGSDSSDSGDAGSDGGGSAGTSDTSRGDPSTSGSSGDPSGNYSTAGTGSRGGSSSDGTSSGGTSGDSGDSGPSGNAADGGAPTSGGLSADQSGSDGPRVRSDVDAASSPSQSLADSPESSDPGSTESPRPHSDSNASRPEVSTIDGAGESGGSASGGSPHSPNTGGGSSHGGDPGGNPRPEGSAPTSTRDPDSTSSSSTSAPTAARPDAPPSAPHVPPQRGDSTPANSAGSQNQPAAGPAAAPHAPAGAGGPTGAPGGGAPGARPGGAGGWTGTPGSPGTPSSPGSHGSPGTSTPRTPDTPPAGRGPGSTGASGHSPAGAPPRTDPSGFTPGARPAGPHGGPPHPASHPAPHSPPGSGPQPGPPAGQSHSFGPQGPVSRGPGAPPHAGPGPAVPGIRPDGNGPSGPGGRGPSGPPRPGPGGHGPDGPPPHRSPDGSAQPGSRPQHDTDTGGADAPTQRPSPDEVNRRHAESTPAGSSFHRGDRDMGDLPHRVQPDPDGRYTVDVHVTADGRARIGDHYYTPEEFADILRRNGDYDGRPIRLIGCDAGSNDFARRLSNELDTPVLAPDKPAWTDSNGRVFSSDYEIGPDGKVRPKIPPNGEWDTHYPDGSSSRASDDAFAPDTDDADKHQLDPDDAEARGDGNSADDGVDGSSDDPEDDPEYTPPPSPRIISPDDPAFNERFVQGRPTHTPQPDSRPIDWGREPEIDAPHRERAAVPDGNAAPHRLQPQENPDPVPEPLRDKQPLKPYTEYAVNNANGTKTRFFTDGDGNVKWVEATYGSKKGLPEEVESLPGDYKGFNPDLSHPLLPDVVYTVPNVNNPDLSLHFHTDRHGQTDSMTGDLEHGGSQPDYRDDDKKYGAQRRAQMEGEAAYPDKQHAPDRDVRAAERAARKDPDNNPEPPSPTDPVDKANARVKWAGGHLVANELGGLGEYLNMHPQMASSNSGNYRDGWIHEASWRKQEEDLVAFAKVEGQDIRNYQVRMTRDADGVPSNVTMRWQEVVYQRDANGSIVMADGKPVVESTVMKERIFPNRPGEVNYGPNEPFEKRKGG